MLPPSLPIGLVRQAVQDNFALEGEWTRLDGERDQNFRLNARTGSFVVKLCNPFEGRGLAAAQLMALEHIAAVDAALPVPRVVRTVLGAPLALLPHGGLIYPLMLLSWLPGEVMGDSDMPAQHYHALGGLVGRLTRSLRGFAHAAFPDRQLPWNTAAFLPAAEDVARLPPGIRGRIADIQSDFDAAVRPRLPEFPSQVIHGDVHPYNTLLDSSGSICGVIDFGDMVHGPRILDLANTLADCLLPAQDWAKVIRHVVSGYVKETPLEEGEVDLVLPLMRARLALTALITARRRSEGAAVTPQIAALDAASLDILKMLDDAHPASEIRFAANFGAQRSTPSSLLMDRRLAAMGPKPLLFYDEPLHFVKGDGVWLTALDGRRYLDCYNNVPHVGHANTHVAEAVARQMRVLNTNTRYLTDESVTYAERLKATLHPSLDTVIFVNSGSEANDVAWRMANVFTGKRGALCMDFAYHGVTMATDMLSPSNYPPGKWQAPFVRAMEAPDVYRTPLACADGEEGEAFAGMVGAQIASLDEAGHGASIAIIDSAFMTNGIPDVPKGYVQGIARRVRKAGGLFIADEVQSGFGRMGTHMWGHQHHGVVPDFVTIGKPAGNGYPLGAIITRAEILERFVGETGPFFSTFGGGNAACAAGIAVLDVMEQENLLANSLSTGMLLREGLRGLMAKHPLIGDVRGSGLATGVELVKHSSTREPAAGETRRVINLIKTCGILVGSDGKLGNVLKIRPPLVFGPEHARMVVGALDNVLTQLS
jgi:4-aminobutyrate aminotransferase-like enzyme/Ser/Thr protein kinase RdoA (MazF antagonist)